jgi:hypothetical protein
VESGLEDNKVVAVYEVDETVLGLRCGAARG